jgi:hypothetical protein
MEFNGSIILFDKEENIEVIEEKEPQQLPEPTRVKPRLVHRRPRYEPQRIKESQLYENLQSKQRKIRRLMYD